jgi:hypothetical protein
MRESISQTLFYPLKHLLELYLLQHLNLDLMCNNYTWTEFMVLYVFMWYICVFPLHWEFPDMILEDKSLIYNMVLSQLAGKQLADQIIGIFLEHLVAHLINF